MYLNTDITTNAQIDSLALNHTFENAELVVLHAEIISFLILLKEKCT